ncbi:enoyl-CoA hydratase-related protein [Streptosporangium sp. NPDC002544]|uniref:enoyl-CoA hydratase-related protein n=1 Tax=Streptosporangium sp. NPDC002544 TaxID=3154538 RepID=UPI003318575B
MAGDLRVSVQDGVAEVVLDRPPVNALARTTYREIAEVFGAFGDRTDVSVVVFTGAGERAFCAGRDIKDLAVERSEPSPVDVGDPYRATREAFWAVRRCAVPVICAVNGAAIGAGLALAAVSDIVIASERSFFALTEIDVGVLGAASFAQWMVGPGRARRMIYTGERVSAQEMYRLGGLDSVVPQDRLLDDARALAKEIAGKSPVAIRMAKASVLRSDTLPLEAAYRAEQDYTQHLSAYADSAAAIARFTGR